MMKYIITIFFFIISLESFSQIDDMVKHIADSASMFKTDSLAKALDSSVTYIIFTKDATPTNVDTLFVPNNSIYHYKITILVINTANGDAGNGQYNAIMKNVGNKVVIFRNAATMTMSYQGTIASARYSISQNGIISITGVKNLIMKWVVKIEEISHLQVP